MTRTICDDVREATPEQRANFYRLMYNLLMWSKRVKARREREVA